MPSEDSFAHKVHQQRSAEKRKLVLQTLYDLLSSGRKFENISINDISEAANISRNSFYHYFVNKEAALIALYNGIYLEEVVPMLQERFDSELSLWDVCGHLVERYLHMAKNHPKVTKAYNEYLVTVDGPPVMSKELDMYQRQVNERLREYFEQYSHRFPNPHWREHLILRSYGFSQIVHDWYLGSLNGPDLDAVRVIDDDAFRDMLIDSIVSHLLFDRTAFLKGEANRRDVADAPE